MPEPPLWRGCWGSRSSETFDFGRPIGGPWKGGSRFVNMGRMLLLGAYPSGTHLGNPGQ